PGRDADRRADVGSRRAAGPRRARGTPASRFRPLLISRHAVALPTSETLAGPAPPHPRHATADGGRLCDRGVLRLLAVPRPPYPPRPDRGVRLRAQPGGGFAGDLLEPAVDPAGLLFADHRRRRDDPPGGRSGRPAEGFDRV